jgi:hypothetical protein
MLGRCPTRWRHMVTEQLLNCPAMIGDACRHRGCSQNPVSPFRPSLIQRHPQAVMIRTEIVNRADQIHTGLERWSLMHQTAPAPHQARQPCAEGRVDSFNVGGVNDSAALGDLQQGIHLRFRTLHNSPHHVTDMSMGILFHHVGRSGYCPRVARADDLVAPSESLRGKPYESHPDRR